ncbi:MAG TPA: iron-sulfur cluster assembly scaffold protein [Anaeromyxobacter sp.]|nr:iron-sulfur cluster assembly scaffold protein [Anaeromyxobacter sp.]
MYTPEVLDHFRSPRNAGVLKGANAHGRAENPGCGDEVELSVRLEGGRIADLRFRARGCVAAIACASRLTELARGRPVGEALGIDASGIAASLGGLPQASGHAAALAIQALRAALSGFSPPVPGTNTVPP